MRPIDADALIEKCGGWYVEEGTESGFIGTLKNLLATEPTIQPQPKEGHWIDKGDDGDWAWQIDGRGNTWHVWGCSECGKSVFVESDYCPHCGSYNGGGRK